jgi:hypothetical protein
MKTMHTKGPWKITYDGGIYSMPNDEDKFSHQICVFNWSSFKEFNEGNNAANARLIVSAPELLAALELSLRNVEAIIYMLPVNDDINQRQSLETWRDGLLRAIAKATGGQS